MNRDQSTLPTNQSALMSFSDIIGVTGWHYGDKNEKRYQTATPANRRDGRGLKRKPAENAFDENLLLSRARSLDPEALAEIHDIYYTPIFRYVAMRVSDQQTAEDITSEVFTRLLTALQEKSAPQKTLRGWLYGVASRVVSDHYRRHYRRQLVQVDESLPAQTESPADVLNQKLDSRSLLDAIQILPESQQEVLALRFGQGLAIKEVASLIGKSEGAVKQLQARAVSTLADRLGTLGVSL